MAMSTLSAAIAGAGKVDTAVAAAPAMPAFLRKSRRLKFFSYFSSEVKNSSYFIVKKKEMQSY